MRLALRWRDGRVGAFLRASWLREALCSVSIALLPGVAYHKILGLWWMWDDPFQIGLCAAHGWRDLLMNRELWHNFPGHVFTPLLFWSLKLDLVLFGQSASAWYAHQLVAATVAFLCLYAAMRGWLDRLSSWSATAVIILSPAVAHTIPQLMSRHYFEGLIFAALSAVALRRDHDRASAILYAGAVLAKEIFVPLPVIFTVLPGVRVRRLLPHGVVAVIYSVIRIVVVGMAVGGGWRVPRSEWPLQTAMVFARVIRTLVQDGKVVGAIYISVVLVCAAAAIYRFKSMRWAALAAGFCAIAPIVPVSLEMQARYVLITAIFLSIAAVRGNVAQIAAVIVLAVVTHRVSWGAALRSSQRMSDEGRVFSRLAAGDVLYKPAVPPQTLVHLKNLTQSAGGWQYDELPICRDEMRSARLFTYDRATRTVRGVSRAEISEDCGRVRVAPLAADFWSSGDNLFWHLGPYGEGTYSLVLANGLQAFDVPRAIGYQVPAGTTLPLRVRYESPARWITYSPDFVLDLGKPVRLKWHR